MQAWLRYWHDRNNDGWSCFPLRVSPCPPPLCLPSSSPPFRSSQTDLITRRPSCSRRGEGRGKKGWKMRGRFRGSSQSVLFVLFLHYPWSSENHLFFRHVNQNFCWLNLRKRTCEYEHPDACAFFRLSLPQSAYDFLNIFRSFLLFFKPSYFRV